MDNPDRAGGVVFHVSKASTTDSVGPRTGTLQLPGRRKIDTPNFFALSSRGAVPHVTPDNLARHTQVAGTYMALEDLVEKSSKGQTPAILGLASSNTTPRPLATYTATPHHVITVLGARRHPAVPAPMGNGHDYISLFASTGFQKLTNEDYCRAVSSLAPDIAVPLADLTFDYGASKQKLANPKRQLRMLERTEEWLVHFFDLFGFSKAAKSSLTSVFAPLLPVPFHMQWDYLNRLEEDHISELAGLAVYDADILPDLENYTSLMPLPRLSLDFLMSPHEILRQVRLGMDVFTLPFLNATSDAGVALTFAFPPPSRTAGGSGSAALGVDMWSVEHQASLEPLTPGCTCYVCTKHHRAYVRHLLNAREMLGWSLLQVHNHAVVSDFFSGIRASLNKNPSTFEEDCDRFSAVYEPELPQGSSQKPRARGYHFKAEAGQKPINKSAWAKYDSIALKDQGVVDGVAGLSVTGDPAEELHAS